MCFDRWKINSLLLFRSKNRFIWYYFSAEGNISMSCLLTPTLSRLNQSKHYIFQNCFLSLQFEKITAIFFNACFINTHNPLKGVTDGGCISRLRSDRKLILVALSFFGWFASKICKKKIFDVKKFPKFSIFSKFYFP